VAGEAIQSIHILVSPRHRGSQSDNICSVEAVAQILIQLVFLLVHHVHWSYNVPKNISTSAIELMYLCRVPDGNLEDLATS
jgi:hypothetical protein